MVTMRLNVGKNCKTHLRPRLKGDRIDMTKYLLLGFETCHTNEYSFGLSRNSCKNSGI